MVESNGRDPRETAVWRRAMREENIPEEKIDAVVVATETRPEDLITLQQAVDLYGIPPGTLRGWISVGHLEPKKRLRHVGGGLILVDKRDVAQLKAHRPKIGRPRKNGDCWTLWPRIELPHGEVSEVVKSNRVNGRPEESRWLEAMREVGVPQETIEAVVVATETKPEDLITLQQAQAEFNVRVGTLHSYLQRGHLHRHGLEPFPARGGGKILIDRRELKALLENPPRTGRPPKNGRLKR